MPKTLPERIFFTIVMAAIMVYGMIVLQCGAEHRRCHQCHLCHGSARDADHGSHCLRAGIFRGGETGHRIGVYVHAAHRSSAVHHLCHLADDRVHHVPGDEPDRNGAV